MSDLKFLKKAVRETIAREKYGLLTESVADELAASQAAIRARNPEDVDEFPFIGTEKGETGPVQQTKASIQNIIKLYTSMLGDLKEMTEEELKAIRETNLFIQERMLSRQLSQLPSRNRPSADSKVDPEAKTQAKKPVPDADEEGTKVENPKK